MVRVQLPANHASSSRKTGASADTSNLPPQPAAAAIPLVVPPPSRQADSPPLVEVAVAPQVNEEEVGFVDSVFGDGTQSRIVASVSDWVSSKAKSNPGCVERLVCETYRTGETMSGFPYLLMQITK